MAITIEGNHTASYVRHPDSNKTRFSSILVTTDFSPQSLTAMRIAASLARQFHGSLLFVHSVPPILYGAGLEACTCSDLMNSNIDGGRARMKEAIAGCKALRGLEYQTIIESGSLIEIIDDLVNRRHVDLIVCGSHGAHGIEKLVLGSTAEALVRNADCPVMIVGPMCIPRGLPCESILFPTDLTAGSLRFTEYVGALAKEMNAQLNLLHVAPFPLANSSEAEIKDTLSSRLRESLPLEIENWCHVKTHIAFGEAGKQVSEIALQQGAGLIVMAVKENRMLADHAPWGVLTHTIQKSPCPVLAIRDHLIH